MRVVITEITRESAQVASTVTFYVIGRIQLNTVNAYAKIMEYGKRIHMKYVEQMDAGGNIVASRLDVSCDIMRDNIKDIPKMLQEVLEESQKP